MSFRHIGHCRNIRADRNFNQHRLTDAAFVFHSPFLFNLPTQMPRNIMLTIAYDGTKYCGWQVQPNGMTVQDRVENAIERVTGVRTRVYCAGRTDSGVHAMGQVASFMTESKIKASQFRRGLQTYLPTDISIVQTAEVSPEFHATFSAIRKRYRYLIFDGPVLPPFLRNNVFRNRHPLDVAAMQRAIPHLLGTHDFRCFESSWPNKATSIRTVMDVTIRRTPHWNIWNNDVAWQPTDARPHDDPASPIICFEIMADGFLYNMVRAIVGTLLDIGSGRKPPEHMASVIASMARSNAGTTAEPQGLYLVQVDYPEDHLTPPNDSAAPDEIV